MDAQQASGGPSPPAGNPLIALAARRPIALIMISTAIFVFGLISLARLPMDLMPEISRPTVTVRTRYPGAAPEDVEDRVSRRLEKTLSVVRGLRRITSISRAESSDVILEFAWSTEMKAVLQDVREKLDQTFLPDGAEASTILRYDPRLDPILQVGVVGGRDLKSLRLVAEEEVERRLETVPGIAAVRVRGGLEEEIRIEVDESRIRSRGISLAEISQRLAEENLDRVSGLLREGDISYVVRTRNEFRTVEEIGAIPIRRQGGSVIRLADVARLVPTHKEERVITRIDGRPAVKIEILREARANIVELAARVKRRIFGSEGDRRRLAEWRAEQRRAVEETPPTGAEPGDAPVEAATIDGGDREGAEKAAGEEDGEDDGEEGATEEEDAPPPPAVARPDIIVAYLPEGVELTLLSDQSVFIESAIHDLEQTAMLGGLLAVAVLFLFLGRFSYTAIVTLAIPCSVVTTFAPMYLGGITLNIMSLGGLALGVGMLVDSSIVVLESIFRRRQEGLPGLRAAIEGATDVGGAVLASTLTTVAVFFPIVFVEGMAGQVFRDQALTVVFSLLASLIVALTLIPMLAARFGGGGPGAGAGRAARLPYWRFRWRQRVRAYWKGSGGTPRPRKQQVLIVIMLPAAVAYLLLALIVELVGALLYTLYLAFATAIRAVGRGLGGGAGLLTRAPLRLFQAAYERVEAIYLRLIDRALRRRGVVFAIVFITLAGALLCSRMLGSELIPGVARGEFVLHLSAPVGSPLASTEARVREIERRLQGIPGIASLATTVGVDPEDVESSGEGEHSARVHVRLERRREKMADLETRVLSDLHSIVVEFPDLDSKVTRPALFSFRTPFEVEIRGHKLAALRRISDEVRQLLEGLPDALTDVRSSVARGSPEYHLYPDREKMSRYGVTSEQIAGALRRKNMGEVATRYRRDDRRLDVRVQLEEQDRASIGRLLSLVVAPRDDGGGWTLEDLVERWEVREGPAEIRRVGRQRAAVISADLAGLDLGRVAESIEERILSEIRLPPDVSIEVTGQKKEMERSQGSLIEALLLAVFLVYVVMASQFESLLQPFIILFTIPLAAVGVMGTLWATATPLSMMAFIGMIMLAGIVVNNAIVLLDQINRLRREGYRPREAIIEGGRRRLRPILMTTLTTVLAMVPLTGVLAQVPHDPSLDFILGTGQGAEIRAPLALTVIGGLLSSTLLTLVVIPVVTSLVLRERGRGDEDGERGGA